MGWGIFLQRLPLTLWQREQSLGSNTLLPLPTNQCSRFSTADRGMQNPPPSKSPTSAPTPQLLHEVIQLRKGCSHPCCVEGLSDSKRQKVNGIQFTQLMKRGLPLIALVQRSQWWDLILDQTASPHPHSLLTLCFGWFPPKQDPQSFLRLVPKHSLISCTIQRLQFLKPWQEQSVSLAVRQGKGQVSEESATLTLSWALSGLGERSPVLSQSLHLSLRVPQRQFQSRESYAKARVDLWRFN